MVRGVRSEDGDCVAGRESIDSGLVGFRVANVAFGICVEGCVEAVVYLADILVEMFAFTL
jgi:hypothetical protein